MVPTCLQSIVYRSVESCTLNFPDSCQNSFHKRSDTNQESWGWKFRNPSNLARLTKLLSFRWGRSLTSCFSIIHACCYQNVETVNTKSTWSTMKHPLWGFVRGKVCTFPWQWVEWVDHLVQSIAAAAIMGPGPTWPARIFRSGYTYMIQCCS